MDKILILGSSERQNAIAGIIGKHNSSVMHFKNSVTKNALNICDAVIMPFPASENGYISGTQIKTNDIFGFGNKIYIGGRLGDEFEPYRKKYRLFDYTLTDDFALKNAFPTAEAAIMTALNENRFTLKDSKCLVCGIGRIGKALLPPLISFGAEVFAAARSTEAREYAEKLGAAALTFDNIAEIGKVDTVFNTVPEIVLGSKELISLNPRTLIDLASLPGGVDCKAAENLDINAIHALALPGRHFPETAARITAETILLLLNQIRNGDIPDEF